MTRMEPTLTLLTSLLLVPLVTLHAAELKLATVLSDCQQSNQI